MSRHPTFGTFRDLLARANTLGLLYSPARFVAINTVRNIAPLQMSSSACRCGRAQPRRPAPRRRRLAAPAPAPRPRRLVPAPAPRPRRPVPGTVGVGPSRRLPLVPPPGKTRRKGQRTRTRTLNTGWRGWASRRTPCLECTRRAANCILWDYPPPREADLTVRSGTLAMVVLHQTLRFAL